MKTLKRAKYQGAFYRIMGFTGEHFPLFPLPSSFLKCFSSRSNFHTISQLETLQAVVVYSLDTL